MIREDNLTLKFHEDSCEGMDYSSRMGLGVNLAGFSRAEMGLGESIRSLARALEAVDIPFCILNLQTSNPSRHDDRSWVHLESTKAPYDVSVINVLPDVFDRERLLLPESFFQAKKVIGFGVWETQCVPETWQGWIDRFDEIWVPSHFAKKAFQARTKKPVIRIPHSIEIQSARASKRPAFSLPEEKFLFLTSFDPFSVPERKNPQGTIEAFQAAFSPDDPNVELVVKVNNPQRAQGLLEAWTEKTRAWPNIRFLPRILSRSEMTDLIASVDCFVSLHRAEGFGLVGAEAMSLAKPCILTAWSGNLDYMVSGGAYAVPFRLVELETDIGPYQKGQVWAQPDLAQAAALMKTVAKSRDEARAVGLRGRAYVRESLAPRVVGNVVLERLKEFNLL